MFLYQGLGWGLHLKMKILKKSAIIICFLAFIVMDGCRTHDADRKERVKKADRYFNEMKGRVVPADKVFTLKDCIETALKNNLDLRVYKLAEDVNREKQTAAILAMLPDLNISYNLTGRNNEPGASSESLLTNTQSLEPSKSVEKVDGTLQFELVFSVVDFGLSYFNSLQARDRNRLVQEQRARAAQNLVFDVARAYYRVAAAQYAKENTEKLLKLSKVIEDNLENIAKSRSLSTFRILAEKKQILRLKQRLEEYKRVYDNSCIELKTLMGYSPWGDIQVDTSLLKRFEKQKVPEIDLLEKVAIRNCMNWTRAPG
jgi:outer membrane protein TolC